MSSNQINSMDFIASIKLKRALPDLVLNIIGILMVLLLFNRLRKRIFEP